MENSFNTAYDAALIEGGFWVFGYGSLMWQPGFPVAERVVADLPGYRRGFCLLSIHHRGTADAPGLVLALEPKGGQVCPGVAFRVAEEDARATLNYLRERELVSAAYRETTETVELHDGRTVEAVCYVIDEENPQYMADLSVETQAHIIARAVGGRGPNWDYLYATAAHLEELGLPDKGLTDLATRVRGLRRCFAEFGAEAGGEG
ncbi:gamma-glutamylcyclotransferase [Paracoccaceae bacterium GXU_MW_L88]